GVRCSTLNTECKSLLCLMTMPGRSCVAGIAIPNYSLVLWGSHLRKNTPSGLRRRAARAVNTRFYTRPNKIGKCSSALSDGRRGKKRSPPSKTSAINRQPTSTFHSTIAVVLLYGRMDPMNDQGSDFATNGEYQHSESGNLGMGLTMLFVGLAAGALIGLLLAPKTGKQMRRSLRRTYEDAREAVEDFSDQAGDWIDKGSEWAEKAKSKVAPLGKPFQR